MISVIRTLTAILAFCLGIGVVSLFPPLPNLRPVSDIPDIFEDVPFAELMHNRDAYEGHRIRTRIREVRRNNVGLHLSGPMGETKALLGVCEREEGCDGFITRHPELIGPDREVIVTGVFHFMPSTCGYGSNGTIVIYNIAGADN
jgi:hypothetical protein